MILFHIVGVNNLTDKVGTRKVEPVYDNIPDLMNDLTDKFTKLKSDLKRRCDFIIISQIVEIDIDTYNKNVNQGRWYYQQQELNRAMPLLAHTVNLINQAENVIGPWVTGTVHNYVNHKLYNRYAKLKDGLHPTDYTKEAWAKKFAQAIVRICNK